MASKRCSLWLSFLVLLSVAAPAWADSSATGPAARDSVVTHDTGVHSGNATPTNSSSTNPEVPEELRGIEIEQNLGDRIPLDAAFTDHEGKQVTLRHYFKPGRPVILTMNYYNCHTLCNLVLVGTAKGLSDPALTFSLGKDFEVVTVSIDPTDTVELAKKTREDYSQLLSRPLPQESWPFLTGSQASIRLLADALGFHYRYDEASKQFAHAAGIFVLTSDGQISQVLYGIDFPGKVLRLALTEASSGSIGSPFDKILLWCYHYDAKERKYTPWALGMMRLGGVITLIGLSILLVMLWRGERFKKMSKVRYE